MSARVDRDPSGQRDDVAAELADLVARFGLASELAPRLTALLTALTEDPHAPTTLHDPLTALRDHLADSLVALELDHVPWAGLIADLGAGAGLPGLPLAIALPDSRLALVESNTRKCAFLTAVTRRCEIANADVVRSRAELWREGSRRCDVVVVRAVASLPVVAEYAAPLLRIGGALVAWRGRRDAAEEAAASRAAAALGLRPLEPVSVKPYPEARHRHLHVMLKLADTPARFPRRPGAAVKHPLGAAMATRARG